MNLIPLFLFPTDLGRLKRGSMAEWLERRFEIRSAGFEIRRSRVQIPFWPLADVVLGSTEFNFSSTLVNSQLVCLPPVGFLTKFCLFITICLHWSWKAPMESGQLRIHIHLHLHTPLLAGYSPKSPVISLDAQTFTLSQACVCQKAVNTLSHIIIQFHC